MWQCFWCYCLCVVPTLANPPQGSLDVRPFRHLEWSVSVDQWEQQYSKHDVVVPTIWKKTDDFDASLWTRDALRKHCGKNLLLRPDRKGCEKNKPMENQEACHDVSISDVRFVGQSWGGLVSADLRDLNLTTVEELLDAQDAAFDEASGQRIVLFDAPLRHYCPKLQDSVRVPKYFGRDYLLLKEWYKDDVVQRPNKPNTASSFSHDFVAAQMKHNWPSIIVSKQDSGTFLHADGHVSRFWATQLSGRKRWRVFDVKASWKLLLPNVTFDFYPRIFEADAFHPNFDLYPALDGTVVYETVTTPGDTILIPEGWPHQVQNIEDSVLTSGNFFDRHTLRTAVEYERGFRGQMPQLYDAFFMPLGQISNQEEKNLHFTFVLLRNRYLQFEKTVPDSVVEWVESYRQCIDVDWDISGWTPLQVAVLFDFRVVVDYLLQAGQADVDAVARDGHTTALDLADYYRRDELRRRLVKERDRRVATRPMPPHYSFLRA